MTGAERGDAPPDADLDGDATDEGPLDLADAFARLEAALDVALGPDLSPAGDAGAARRAADLGAARAARPVPLLSLLGDDLRGGLPRTPGDARGVGGVEGGTVARVGAPGRPPNGLPRLRLVSGGRTGAAAGATAGFDPARPLTRGDCADGFRPCPWRDCRHHLWVERRGRDGAGTCALDFADLGPMTLTEVGALLGVTRERVRQIEAKAKRKLAKRGIRLRSELDD